MQKIFTFLPFLLFAVTLSAQITGTVFQDGNGDGIFQPTEAKVEGVTIIAYNSAGGQCGTVISSSNASPNYSISGCSGAVRLEFIIPNNVGCGISSSFDFSAASGADTKTSIQFTTAPSANNNFGLISLDAFVQNTNPTMFVPCYINGWGAQGTTAGDGDAFVSFLYNSSGVPMSQGGTAPNPTHLAYAYQIGSTWGTAYSKAAKRVFLSAFMKRHVGMGPGGSGAIYIIDPANPPAAGTIPSYIDLDALGIATRGSGAYVSTPIGFHPVIGNNSTDRNLPTSKTQPSNDPSAFGQVGKVSLGDIDISDDGRYLYVVNLFDKKLYQIDLQNGQNPVMPTSAQVKSYDAAPWLNQSCANGVSRAFATKFYRGKVYVGVVCTGENSTYPSGQPNRLANDLRAFVYEVDPTGNGSSASIALEFPLNYEKETPGRGDATKVNGWYAWTDTWSEFSRPLYNSFGGSYPFHAVSHPQPILGDIEIDSDGSFILSFLDRGGHQAGTANNDPAGNRDPFGGTAGFSYVVGGDILRTYKDKTTCSYVLESNGVAGPYTSTSQAPVFNNGVWSGTGPSIANGNGSSHTGYFQTGSSGTLVNNTAGGYGKEFYWGDYANLFGNNYPTPQHNEGVVGGMAILPSSGEVMIAAMDPVDGKPWSGGVYSLNNTTGARNNGYNLYSEADIANNQGVFGKANGLGDVEITGEIPPVEIGNRVWLDTNNNGIQDAGEAGIAGVNVELYNPANTTVIATATTDANGNYIFSTGSGTSTNAFKYGLNLTFGTNYQLRIVGAQGGSQQTPLATYSVTSKDADATANGDARDNDGTVANTSVIAFTLGTAGQNNHSYDFGFRAAPVCPTYATAVPTAICHANGTPELGTDDFMTFAVTITPSVTSIHTYTITATQGGNPIAVTLSNGTPATAVNCGLSTPLRTSAGSAGQGNITLTITDNVNGCTHTVTIIDSGACTTQCTPGSSSMVMYNYATQIDKTELNNLPILLPQFDQQGGAKTLTSVTLEYTIGAKTAFAFENSAAQAQMFEASSNVTPFISLDGVQTFGNALTMEIPFTSIGASVLVPPTGSWPGDSLSNGTLKTLVRMNDWADQYLINFKDPRNDPRWVSNATGNAADDDDILVYTLLEDTYANTLSYSTPSQLAPFIGTGNIPLDVSTLSGFGILGGGGNITAQQYTRAFATAKITYNYSCSAVCTVPSTITTTQTPPTCTGATSNNNGVINVTAVTGSDKYGVSTGATYTGPAYATATALPALPFAAQSMIPNTGGTYTIRFFNGDNACFLDQVVTVAAVTCFSQVPLTCGMRLDSLSALQNSNTTGRVSSLQSSSVLIGGERDMNYVTNAPVNSLGTFFEVGPYFSGGTAMDIANVSVALSTLTVQWDGIDNDPVNLNPIGLGGLNFTASGINKITAILNADFPSVGNDSLAITIEIHSNAGAASKIQKNFKFINNTNNPIEFDLNNLVPFIGSGASLSNIGAIVMFINMEVNPVSTRSGWDVLLRDITLDCSNPCTQPSGITITQTAPTCTGATANNNGTINVTAVTGSDKYGVSTGGTYTGSAYATATATPAGTFAAQSMIPNAGGTYTIRFFNGDNACFTDEVVTVAAVTCSATCTQPSGITTMQTAPTCTGATAINNGVINVTAVTGSDKYSVSTGGTYTGPAYATATSLPALPFAAQSMIPNAGGTYTIRFFNGDNACFTDEVVTVGFVSCNCPPSTCLDVTVLKN